MSRVDTLTETSAHCDAQSYVDLNTDNKTTPRCNNVSILDSTSIDPDSVSIASTWLNSIAWTRGKLKNCRQALTTARICKTIPWVVLWLGMFQIVVFLWFFDSLYSWMAFSAKSHFEVWRFLTYSLLHSSYLHLAINLIVQFTVGIPLELEQGHLRTLFVYLSSVAAGACASLRYQPDQTLIGASAGGFGLLISHLPHTLLNFEVLPYRYYRLVGVVFFCASDLIDATVSNALSKTSYMAFKTPPTISKCAHLGGAICGILLGFIVYSGHRGIVLDIVRILCISLAVAISAYLMVESNRIFA